MALGTLLCRNARWEASSGEVPDDAVPVGHMDSPGQSLQDPRQWLQLNRIRTLPDAPRACEAEWRDAPFAATSQDFSMQLPHRNGESNAIDLLRF
jgi:hypothetical protein